MSFHAIGALLCGGLLLLAVSANASDKNSSYQAKKMEWSKKEMQWGEKSKSAAYQGKTAAWDKKEMEWGSKERAAAKTLPQNGGYPGNNLNFRSNNTKR